MIERIPLINQIPPEKRPIAAFWAVTLGGGAVGGAVYNLIYSRDIAEQGRLSAAEGSLGHQTDTLRGEEKALLTARQTLARYGIQSPSAVDTDIRHDMARITLDQTKTATLQREYPHPAVPVGVFEIAPGVLAMATLLSLAVRGVRRKNRSSMQKQPVQDAPDSQDLGTA